MRTSVGGGVAIAVGSEPDTDATSFHNGNAAGWARNWFILATLFLVFIAIAGARGKR